MPWVCVEIDPLHRRLFVDVKCESSCGQTDRQTDRRWGVLVPTACDGGLHSGCLLVWNGPARQAASPVPHNPKAAKSSHLECSASAVQCGAIAEDVKRGSPPAKSYGDNNNTFSRDGSTAAERTSFVFFCGIYLRNTSWCVATASLNSPPSVGTLCSRTQQ